MAVLDRLVLRLAIYELLAEPETPPKVVINEALELARSSAATKRWRSSTACSTRCGSNSAANRQLGDAAINGRHVRRTFRESDQVRQRRANFEELVAARRRSVPARVRAHAHHRRAGRGAYGEDRRASSKPSSRATRTAGRILAIRSFGKANFLVLSDGRAKIQVYIRQDALSERDFAIFKLLDFGDFVGVEGRLFRTKTNELTIWASALEFLAKCFLPLPEKWHGLSDVETRYRQRYLDLIVNPDSRRVFEVRSRVLTAIRDVPERAAATSKSRRR